MAMVSPHSLLRHVDLMCCKVSLQLLLDDILERDIEALLRSANRRNPLSSAICRISTSGVAFPAE
jgi:hypothetical protein